MKLEVSYLRIDYKDGYVAIDADGTIDDEDMTGLSLAEVAYLYTEALKISKEVGLHPLSLNSESEVVIGKLILADDDDNSITLSENEDDEEVEIGSMSAEDLLDFAYEASMFKAKYFPKKPPAKKK